ncbi:MAG: GNAT family N-acetyltransferase [Flavobacteriales bacterium]|jgi:phosphinothricin acetyltransferase|nr:GNAT family N-acetyltransferase [Flavobacteriales bacterium]
MIRSAKVEDAEVIAHIYNVYVRQGTSTMDAEKTADDIQSWMSQFSEREGIFVLEENDTIKGWAILKKYSDRYGYRFACETSIYVHNNYLRKGIGDLLNTFIIEKAKALAYKHMTAKIFSINQASIRFFEKYGYTIVGQQNKIGFRNEQWINIVIMEKLL